MVVEHRPKTDHALLGTLLELRQSVEERAATYLTNWHQSVGSSRRSAGEQNMARYLALRCHDPRNLQVELSRRGLSSLGRCESRVKESLEAIITMLGSTLGVLLRVHRVSPKGKKLRPEKALTSPIQTCT